MFVPMWMSNSLPPLFVVSGISTGIALCTIYGAVKVRKVEKEFKLADSILIISELALIGYLLSELSSMSTLTSYPAFSIAAKTTLELMLQGEYSSMFFYGFVGIGLLFPLALYFASYVKKALAIDLLSGLSVLIGGYIFRIIVIAAAAKSLIIP